MGASQSGCSGENRPADAGDRFEIPWARKLEPTPEYSATDILDRKGSLAGCTKESEKVDMTGD